MSGVVTGPRSPRWAFMQKTTIPCEDGLVYLVRLRIVQTPWFAIYLHDLREPDRDRDPHDHPWTFWSVILRGGYTEKVWQPRRGEGVDRWTRSTHPNGYFGPPATYRRRWLGGSVHKMTMDKAHMIESVRPGTKSLVICGRRRRTWGFWTDRGFVTWQQYRP
jgi:hypothetical protein